MLLCLVSQRHAVEHLICNVLFYFAMVTKLKQKTKLESGFQSEGKMQTEALYINKSLTFLEQVVIALADRKREHIPFRQSKLTHYLKDSIGGRCNTVLITNIWSERAQLEETVSMRNLTINDYGHSSVNVHHFIKKRKKNKVKC